MRNSKIKINARYPSSGSSSLSDEVYFQQVFKAAFNINSRKQSVIMNSG